MIFKKYEIKSGYKIRSKNAPYVDEQLTGITYQPDVYEFAKYILERDNLKYLVDIGTGNGEKLMDIDPSVHLICIENETNLKVLKKNLPLAEIIDYDLENGLPRISEDILKEAVIISSDVIEHIVKPHKYLKALSRWVDYTPYLIISTPDRTRARGPEDYGPPKNPAHVREWSIDELHALFNSYSISNMIGYTISNDRDRAKETLLVLAGNKMIPSHEYHVEKKVLAIMTAYNEEDIIEHSIKHLITQGCDVHVIDNWSTDNTLKIIKQLVKTHKNLTYEKFPKKKPDKNIYHWEQLLTRVQDIAKASNYDWIMHNDADELRISPWRNTSISQAVTILDIQGYNAIDFTVIDFRPTSDGFDGSLSPEEFFFDFELVAVPGNLSQIKCWKNTKEIDIASSGGHQAIFKDRKVFPLKFSTKHYALRSNRQAHKKIFNERVNRFDEAEKKKGWHVQYDHYNSDEKFIWRESNLNKYTNGTFYSEYIVERLSGIGILNNPSEMKSPTSVNQKVNMRIKKGSIKAGNLKQETVIPMPNDMSPEEQIKDLSLQIEGLKASKSWRFTQPIRSISGQIRRLTKR